MARAAQPARDPAPVETRALSFRYESSGGAPALGGLTLAMEPGEMLGLLGPNGSGKTTLFRILEGLLTPSSGQVRVFGLDPQQDALAVRARLGVVFQAPALDDHLTVLENLRCHGGLFGRGELEAEGRQALEALGVGERAGDRVATLSGGLKRRVELAKVLITRPALLLMDEPTAGLDPAARRDFWQAVATARAQTGTSVLLSTHDMDEAERCDRLAVLDAGQRVALETPAALKARVGGEVITLELEDAAPEHATALAETLRREFPGLEPLVAGGALRMECTEAASWVPKLAPRLGGAVRTITVGRPDLEDAFFHLTGHDLAAPAPG